MILKRWEVIKEPGTNSVNPNDLLEPTSSNNKVSPSTLFNTEVCPSSSVAAVHSVKISFEELLVKILQGEK